MGRVLGTAKLPDTGVIVGTIELPGTCGIPSTIKLPDNHSILKLRGCCREGFLSPFSQSTSMSCLSNRYCLGTRYLEKPDR